MACDAFYRHRLRKSPFLSAFFGRFSVDDRRKHIKKYAFSKDNALVWMGPYNLSATFCSSTLVGAVVTIDSFWAPKREFMHLNRLRVFVKRHSLAFLS